MNLARKHWQGRSTVGGYEDCKPLILCCNNSLQPVSSRGVIVHRLRELHGRQNRVLNFWVGLAWKLQRRLCDAKC
ncbi:hypothetical protein Mapa_000352 [Marchantia paleacea]|nr:hypothetical protein Mapa_000352 [Marchantia paleacea]